MHFKHAFAVLMDMVLNPLLDPEEMEREREVIQALKNVSVYTLLVSEGIRRALVRLECRSCGYRETRIVDLDRLEEFEGSIGDLACLQCEKSTYEIVEKEDLIEALVRMAEEAGARLEIISTHTEEGEMLSRAFGGIAAITKYRTY